MNTYSNIDYDKQIQELQTKKLQQELEIKIKGLITEKLRIKQEIKNLKGQLKQLTTIIIDRICRIFLLKSRFWKC